MIFGSFVLTGMIVIAIVGAVCTLCGVEDYD